VTQPRVERSILSWMSRRGVEMRLGLTANTSSGRMAAPWSSVGTGALTPLALVD
jgi:hypothetical protein